MNTNGKIDFLKEEFKKVSRPMIAATAREIFQNVANENGFLTVKQFAQSTKLDSKHIRYYCRLGKIPADKLRGIWLISDKYEHKKFKWHKSKKKTIRQLTTLEAIPKVPEYVLPKLY